MVVVLRRGGALVRALGDAGVTVIEGPRSAFGSLRRFRPDVVHGYLAFANALAVACRSILPHASIVQGIRGVQSERDPTGSAVRAAYRVEAFSSRLAHAVIANSEAAREQAVARGFPAGRMHVVPNGIDTDALRRDPVAGKQLRSEWSVGGDEVLVGRVAHFRSTKDYETFLLAAAAAARRRADLRFVVVGDGPDGDAVRARARDLGLEERLVWAGERRDVAAVMSALDVMVSSSRWESFPNVVGEAMACGVPCAVTDTGDSAAIVGTTGSVAPPGSSEELATAVVALVDRVARDGDQLRSAVRTRIEEHFTVPAMVAGTEQILQELVAG